MIVSNLHECENCDRLIDLENDDYEVWPDEGGPDAVMMYYCEFCIMEVEDER